MKYKKIEPKPIFLQIVDQIRDQVASGELVPGEILPSERQFAEILNVNRHTLREALKILEYLGVIESKTGVGTVIRNVSKERLMGLLAKAVSFDPKQFLFKIIELRKSVEPQIAALAAERVTEVEISEMERAMADFHSEFEKGNFGTDACERLHIILANATHNETFALVTDPLISMLHEFREKSLKMPGRRWETYEEHQRIYEAVKNKNPKAASDAMMYHLNQIEAMLITIAGFSINEN